jgi:hypothetical protein
VYNKYYYTATEYSIKKLVEYCVLLLLYSVSVIYDRTVLMYECTIVE